jgi:hypothetical protein
MASKTEVLKLSKEEFLISVRQFMAEVAEDRVKSQGAEQSDLIAVSIFAQWAPLPR